MYGMKLVAMGMLHGSGINAARGRANYLIISTYSTIELWHLGRLWFSGIIQ